MSRGRLIATHLKQSRKALGLSIRQAARLAKLDWPVYYRIEKGETRNPSFRTAMKLCKAFNINPWEVKIA